MSEAPPTSKKKPARRPAVVPRGMTKIEAAIYLGCSKTSLDKLQAAGRLRPIRYPGIRKDFYDRESLDLLMDQAAAETVPTAVPTQGSKYGFLRVAREGKR